MKRALEGLHDDEVEKEEQPELGTTNERSRSRLDEEGAYEPEVKSALSDFGVFQLRSDAADRMEGRPHLVTHKFKDLHDEGGSKTEKKLESESSTKYV